MGSLRTRMLPTILFATLSVAAAGGAQDGVSGKSADKKTAASRTAEKVIARAIKAEGGKVKTKLKTVSMEGIMKFTGQDLESDFYSYQKRPDRLRVEMDIMGMEVVHATDGQVSWMADPVTGTGEPTLMPKFMVDTFRRGASIEGAYYDLKDRKVEWLGRETFGEIETDHVRLTFEDGHTQELYFDTETGLLYRVTGREMGPAGTWLDISATYSDYRKIDGAMFPFRMVQIQSGAEIVFIYDEIKVNVDIDDSLFSWPDSH